MYKGFSQIDNTNDQPQKNEQMIGIGISQDDKSKYSVKMQNDAQNSSS